MRACACAIDHKLFAGVAGTTMSFGKARRGSFLANVSEDAAASIASPLQVQRRRRRKSSSLKAKKPKRRSSVSSISSSKVQRRRRASSAVSAIAPSLLKSTASSRARTMRRSSTASTTTGGRTKKKKRRSSVSKKLRRASSAPCPEADTRAPSVPQPATVAIKAPAAEDSDEFRTPSLPEAIRVRSPPQVLEAIKLTDIELSEVKEYNMLDLGVSMTVETIDSIIPSYDGDDYDDAESIDDGAGREILRPALLERAVERMRPGSASYWARAGAPAVKLSRGRAKADPWWCRDPKKTQALLESSASSWARGDRAALSDRVDMWKLWRRDARHDRGAPIHWVRQSGASRRCARGTSLEVSRKALASEVPPSTYSRPKWGV